MELSIQERLKDLRVEPGLTLEQLAEQTHLSKSALGSYEAEDFKDISHYALIKLAKFYEVTADYLLGLSETKNHPNADLADLRLSDNMIDLLKNELVDNSLLCELTAHPDFPRLMADLEIYVNGVAVKQVQTANAIVDIISATIMKQYNPGLTDPQLRQLVAAHIDADSFCRYVIQQDINGIALDLRETHKDDFFSVPEDNLLEDFLQTVDEVAREDSDPEQGSLAFICKRLKLNYKKLSEEEKEWLKKIAQKSDLLKNPNPQRGKNKRTTKREFGGFIMKKGIAILLAGCLVFSLAACSSSRNSEQPTQMQNVTQEQESIQKQITTLPESSEAEKGTSATEKQTKEVSSVSSSTEIHSTKGDKKEGAEMTADELLDLFIDGSINAIDPTDSTSTFYITDLDMDSEEWDSYSVGEKVDIDNDGENELILNGPYGGIYLDARNNQIYTFAAGEGNGLTLSYTSFNGAIWIMYSNRMHTGYESYHMELFEGADNLVAEMNFNEELIDEDNVEGKEKYYLNGTEITYDEYFELCNKIFATQVNTN